MAQRRVGAATQHRGHPVALSGERRSSDGVYAAPHGMEPSRRDPMIDRALAETELQELRPSHDTVLSGD